jgi:hypothetical protein
MGGFQKTVLIIAIIILIIALVIIGMALVYSNNSTVWPPIVASCPDYWTIDGSGNNTTCTNVKDLGTCPAQPGSKHLTMNFNVAPYTGSNGTCAKYKWSNNCNLAWDGVNYGVSNPCDTSSSSSDSK